MRTTGQRRAIRVGFLRLGHTPAKASDPRFEIRRDDAMTETEWLACNDPGLMLEFLKGKASDRKLRLFACAYSRTVRDSEHLLGPSTVAVAERYADGLASDDEMASERRRWALWPEERWPVAPSAYKGAWEAVDWLTSADKLMKIDPDALRHFPIPTDAVLKRSVLFLRDIFGNPFWPVPLDPAWRTPKVVDLAQENYDQRAFERLPVLADALEEAGCSNADILDNCRGPGPHVRGCWVVDLVLGKG
jgi:hypothetical protein